MYEIDQRMLEVLKKENISEFRPSQKKALDAGLLDSKNILVCTPTASGKTLIAELAITNHIFKNNTKAIYIVPLISLATEKYKEFQRKYSHLFKIALSIGDFDTSDSKLIDYDLIICTSEKLDSLIRHRAEWLSRVSVVIIDEIHLLNDPGRGPTLEILITILKTTLKNVQILALSATIGNPEELADWLGAKLVIDTWRPVPLHKGIFHDGKVEFY